MPADTMVKFTLVNLLKSSDFYLSFVLKLPACQIKQERGEGMRNDKR